jgi:two-component system, NtrC family, sensor kinase
VPSLYVIQGRDQGKRFELEAPRITIGRIAGNAIQLRDTEISREHAEIARRDDEYRIADLGSSNGTFVNGQRVQESELVSGDQVQLGRTLLLFTGLPSPSAEELTRHIAIIDRQSGDDGSQIVHALSHSEGSRIIEAPFSGEESPWLTRARSNLQIMYRTALAVSHTLDIDELLARIMEMIFEWVDADRGCIMLKDHETGNLVPKVQRRRKGKEEGRMAISQTILDYVIEHNEGVLTSNARADERWDPAQSIVQLGIREAICVPLQGRYGMVGVIYIDTAVPPQAALSTTRRLNQFTEEHLKLMIAIAHQAALAIEDTFHYKALVQAERLAAVGQTIATLSHHIKNILQGIRGGSYLIELGLGDHEKSTTGGEDQDADVEAARKAVETIRKGWGIVERNQQRISSMVLDMLTFSKEREPDPRPADLNEVAGDVVQLMASRAKDAKVRLQFKPAAAMPTLMFDPDGLHRAILNVVTNAIDACEGRDGAEVIVSSETDEPEEVARIRVEDNGRGIPADELERIFTVFVSGKGSRGTGLGLPVSQKILQEHGGRIHVESEEEKGSTFTLELPLVLAEDSDV